MVTGPDFSSQNQPDQDRTTVYRDSSKPNLRSDAHWTTIVGSWEKPSGESQFRSSTIATNFEVIWEMSDSSGATSIFQSAVAEARLFASRFDMVTSLGSGRSGCIVEIGVALGKMSAHIVETVRPETFVAIDIFRMHLSKERFWGKTASEWFGEQTHREFYEARMQQYSQTELVLCEGLSRKELVKFPPETFDLIYLDADHKSPVVDKDVPACVRVLKPDGVLIFNDYICYDHIAGKRYGVVEAANKLIQSGKFKVVGFALHPQMFCDLAVTRC